jgi:hypothetical protein
MYFIWNGGKFDTTEMGAFEPEWGHIRGIYWTADCGHVFVVTVDHWTGANIHRADIPEIDRLARKYGISELLSAVA